MSEIREAFTSISEFLGSERVNELKDFVLAELKENMHDTIKEYYLVWPDDLQKFVDGIYEKVKKDIAKKYRDQLTEELSAKVERYLEGLLHEDTKEVVNDRTETGNL